MQQDLSPNFSRVLSAGGVLFLLLAWYTVTTLRLVEPLFLPSPRALFRAIEDFHEMGWLLPAIGRSSLRVAKALVLVTIVGMPIGIAMGALPKFDAFVRVPLLAARSVPVTGLVGLIILWFSIEEAAKVVFLFLGAIFYMIALSRSAALSTRQDLLDVSADLGASRTQQILRVVFPGALPQLWDAISVSNGLMWTYIVLAEFINSNESQLGIGYLLYIGSRTQSSAKVFAALLIIAAISFLTDAFCRYVRQRVLFW